MHSFYDFITGPLLWIAFVLFIGGSVWKIASWWLLARKSDPFVIKYWSWKYAIRSWAHWFLPFGALGWRNKPVLTVVTFAFHLSLVVAPIFLSAHLILLDQWMGFRWAAMPDAYADILTILVIVGTAYFIYRRLFDKQVKFVTRTEDWVILAIVAVTFVCGFLAYHQWGPYDLWVSLHILGGEAFLVMIPFTRVSHMLILPFTRGYIGSEFGAVRKCKDY